MADVIRRVDVEPKEQKKQGERIKKMYELLKKKNGGK